MDRKLQSMIGLCKRAGKISAGAVAAEQAVKSRKASLLIVSKDASDRTKKDYRSMCEYRHVPYLECGSMEELGHAVGDEFHAVLAVTDRGFAEQIRKLSENENIVGSDQ